MVATFGRIKDDEQQFFTIKFYKKLWINSDPNLQVRQEKF